MNGRLTSVSYHAKQHSHSWNKAISNFDLEILRSRSRVWSKGKVLWSALYLIDSHSFCFISMRPTIPEIQLLWNLTLKNPRSRSWMRSRSKSYSSLNIQLMDILFISCQLIQPFLRYGQLNVWPWKNCQKWFTIRISPKSYQVISMTR